MKTKIAVLFLILTASLLPCGAEETGPLGYLKDAEVVVSNSLAAKLKATGFVEGNKIKGTYTGIDKGFAVFTVGTKDKAKTKLFVPLSEITYIVGTERLINF